MLRVITSCIKITHLSIVSLRCDYLFICLVPPLASEMFKGRNPQYVVHLWTPCVEQRVCPTRFLFCELMGGWIGIRDTICNASLLLLTRKAFLPSSIFSKHKTGLFAFLFLPPNRKEMTLNVKNPHLCIARPRVVLIFFFTSFCIFQILSNKYLVLSNLDIFNKGDFNQINLILKKKHVGTPTMGKAHQIEGSARHALGGTFTYSVSLSIITNCVDHLEPLMSGLWPCFLIYKIRVVDSRISEVPFRSPVLGCK